MAREKESRVLEAATSVFLRYGYRRTTMGDIASAAGISRPALYLLFCNKERVFEAVHTRFHEGIVEEIRQGLFRWETPLDKLRFAFDCWAVRPFTLMAGSPDAKDLIHCGHVAGPALSEGYQAFEAQLVGILEALPGTRSPGKPRPEQIAHILATSVRGFKETARSPEELRDMIEVLLGMTVGSLEGGVSES